MKFSSLLMPRPSGALSHHWERPWTRAARRNMAYEFKSFAKLGENPPCYGHLQKDLHPALLNFISVAPRPHENEWKTHFQHRWKPRCDASSICGVQGATPTHNSLQSRQVLFSLHFTVEVNRSLRLSELLRPQNKELLNP